MSAGTPARLGLGRDSRLKLGRDFARVKQSGRRLVNGCLIANWLTLPDESASRVGVVVSKKVGGAVVRNRAKRLLRETFRVHQYEFKQPLDLVLVARSSIVGRAFVEVEKDFLIVMRKAGLLSPESGVQPPPRREGGSPKSGEGRTMERGSESKNK
jgi:ribonuclease P protein component